LVAKSRSLLAGIRRCRAIGILSLFLEFCVIPDFFKY
jgi:hypothetical protein